MLHGKKSETINLSLLCKEDWLGYRVPTRHGDTGLLPDSSDKFDKTRDHLLFKGCCSMQQNPEPILGIIAFDSNGKRDSGIFAGLDCPRM